MKYKITLNKFIYGIAMEPRRTEEGASVVVSFVFLGCWSRRKEGKEGRRELVLCCAVAVQAIRRR